MTMEYVNRKSLFACAYKRGLAGPNEIQNGGQIQNDYIQTSCTEEYNLDTCKCRRVLLSLRSPEQSWSVRYSSPENG